MTDEQNNSQIPLEPHPFGGCNRLLSQYSCIGSELLKYEASTRRYGRGSFSAFSHFREGVSFVSVEVLESYLEDLLDLDVSEDRLFIKRESPNLKWMFVSLLGLSGATSLGLYAASTGASLFASFALTAALALPFAVLWNYAPRGGVTRRIGFAQIVSHEVSRRRGSDKGPRQPANPQFAFTDFIAQKSPGSARSAAFTIFH
ncbi:MAG: hypothetical protein J0M12_00370 [Deltaproteobacteria bacterium]|nr:hypothetical protein [Deltaproteobacteria bacterium]